MKQHSTLGELPKDWVGKPLGDVLSLCQSGVWGEDPDGPADVHPVIRSTEIGHDGRLHLDRPTLAYRKVPEERGARYALQNGDLLVVKSSGSKHLIGRAAFFRTEEGTRVFLFSNFMQRLRANPKVSDPHFLYYVLSSQIAERELERLQETTSGLRNLPVREYLQMTIPMPPLPEQRLIAGVLRLLDELIDRTRWLIERYQQLKKVALRRLLARGIGHTRLKHTELGELPEEWEVRPLGDLLSICQSGVWGEEPDASSDAYPVIRSTEIGHDGRLHLDSPRLAYRKVPQERVPRYALQNGDLLVVKSSGSKHLIGRVAFFRAEEEGGIFLFANFMQRLRANPEVCDPRFLYYVLSSQIADRELERLQETTSGLRNLPVREYLAMAIPVPPLSEQPEIANHLEKLDGLLDNEQRYIDTLAKLKRLWMDRLLTGKVRVPPEAEPILQEALPNGGR